MLPCKQIEVRWVSSGGAASYVVGDRPVSDCRRLSYRGALEEAVCLHMSLYLHRLWPYIKFRALSYRLVNGNR